MFVGSSFLSIVDRTSPNTILTGKTGSSFGLIGTIIFVIVSFVIFIGPIIYYFKGDYIQGSFNSYKFQDLQLYTGVDFKLAIMFRNKKTNQLVNHTKMIQIFKTKGYYFSPKQIGFYSDVNQCNDQYFQEMKNKKHTFQSQDCFILPNNIAYFSEFYGDGSSIIGFIMQPVCRDPFSCTYQSITDAQINLERLNFFSENYYVVYFSGEKLDQWGNKKQQFYQMYSTEFQSSVVKTSIIYIAFGTEKYHMDNSIMPWYNNQTFMLSAWRGKTSGNPLPDNELLANGVGTFMAYDNTQTINYREYKKLDWLLGMLGGGIFIIYLIIWIPCKHVNLIKSKIEIAETTTLIRNDNNLKNVEKPNFSLLWKISTLLPWNLAKFRKQNKIIYASQKLLDVADLVKKLKVTSRNLARTNKLKKFEPRRLDFANYSFKQEWTQQEINEQIKGQDMRAIQNNEKISEICSNHLPMLRLCDMESSEIKNKANLIMEKQNNFSKLKIRKFDDKNNSKCSKICSTIKTFFQKLFTFFDVFGAKPNLLGSPENFSVFGCLTVLLIIVLSVFTFALTIHNMKVVRPYWDSIYKSPAEQNITVIGGQTFKLAICFHEAIIDTPYLVGSDRIADIKFYQYTRNGQQETEQLFTGYRLHQANSTYFEIRDPAFSINLSSCTAVQDGRNYSIYGNSQTEKEAYIGAKIVPYCGLGEQQCLNSTVSKKRLQAFSELIQRFPILAVMPQANYYPQEGKVMHTPILQPFFISTSPARFHYTEPVVMTISVDTLQIIDNYQTWTMGSFPQAKSKYLSTRYDGINTKLQTKSGDISLNIKLVTSGVIDRVVFHSTKIDFLLATIGGIFIFFWFCFSCFSKFYNHYNFKAKLAEVLYTQDRQELSGWKTVLQWLRIPCCSDRVMRKIEQDIQNVSIAKKVDNVYRLSVCQFEREEQKNLALIYLKERIKSDETVAKVDDDQSDSEEGDDDFEGDWEIQKALQNKRLNSNAVQNSSEYDENKQIIVQKQHSPYLKTMQPEPVEDQIPNTNKKCNYLFSFDLFNSNSQLTLDGKRSIQSVCGGVCCIVLFIFLCVLTSHFLTVYFSNWHRVSMTKMTEQDSEVLSMTFTVGQNIKLAMSFCELGDFGFKNVQSLVNQLDLVLVKYLVTNVGGVVSTKNETINLVKCERSYLNGFIGEDEDKDYYNDFNNAYCVPDGTKLSLYGSTGDEKRQYFSLRIDNKQTNSNLTILSILLSKYIPRYHISEPILDYNADGDLRYTMKSSIKAKQYQDSFSSIYNITLTKNIIQYDTAVNPSNQRPSMTTYEMSSSENNQFGISFNDAGLQDRFNELNFYSQDCINKIMIQTIKVNELFGIIGGCIIFLFFGIGCIPTSYNRFKMRYLLGSKLYIVMGQKRISKPKHKSGKIIQKKVFGEQILFSEWSLIQAWLLSFFGFVRNNFNFSQTLRYAALIQSRVSQDINTFDLLKALYTCESSINQFKYLQNENANLCRIFPKQIIPVEETESKECKDMIQIIKKQLSPLVDASRVNKFSDWELKTIIDAKSANVNFADIFNQKWLDKLMGLDRSTMGSMGGRSSYSGYRTNYFKNRPSHQKPRNQVNFDENNSESDNGYRNSSSKQNNEIGKMRRESNIEIGSQGKSGKMIEGIEGESFENINDVQNMDIE